MSADSAARALALCVEPDHDSLMLGAAGWPQSVDRRTPGLPFWPSGQCSTVAVRLPRAREELAMLLHAGAAALKPGGTLYLAGTNPEGIASAQRALAQVFESVETAAIKFHARVFAARGPKTNLKRAVADWRSTFSFEVNEETFAHVTYPGVFAHGRLDSGTRLLVESLTPLHGRVLDFAAGSGAIAQVLRCRQPDLALTLADIDAIALEAARENVPEAAMHQIAALSDLPPQRFDAIVSNPPIHDGVAQSYGVLSAFLEAAPSYLSRDGVIYLVTQRTVPVAKLATAFSAQPHAQNASFTVWQLQPLNDRKARPNARVHAMNRYRQP